MDTTFVSKQTKILAPWLQDVNDLVYRQQTAVSITKFGAAVGNSDAVNKAALQAAIAAASLAGGGRIIVPPTISYGYKVADSTTWPDFSAATATILIEDYGPGKDYSGYPTSYNGEQARKFFFTPQTTKPINFTTSLLSGVTSATLASPWVDITGPWTVVFASGERRNVTLTNGATTATWTGGLTSNESSAATYINPGNHDGNTQWHRASWAPSIVVMNDANLAPANDPARTATDNRRANLYFGVDGLIAWKIGQGQNAGPQYTNEELSNFGITLYGSSIIGDFNWLTVERKTGNASFGGQVNTPPASFHFKSPSSGVIQHLIESLNSQSQTSWRTSAGSAKDVSVRNNDGSLELRIEALGTGLSIDKTTRRCTPGLALGEQLFILPYSASIAVDTTKGNIASITATNNTNFNVNAPTGVSVVTGETQILTFTVRNTSGGALGTATWDPIYKMAAWTQPATGFSRSITFYWNGTNWIEMNRTTVDIPN